MFCIHCGKELDDGSKFCIHCGKRLEDEKDAETPADLTPVKPDDTGSNIHSRETGSDEPRSAEEKPDTSESAVEAAKENVEKAIEAVNATAESAAEALAETAEAVGDSSGTEENKETSAEEPVAPEELPVEKEGGAKALDIRALAGSKTALIVAASLLGLVLLVVIAVFATVSGTSGSSGIKGCYLLYEDSGESVAVYNGKRIKSLELTTDAYLITESRDGSKAVIKDGSSALYYLDNGKSSNITGDFDGAWIALSDDGSTVAYPYDDSVYLYKGGNKKKIADFENELCSLVLSPNGDTVAYAVSDGDKVSTYAYKSGKLSDLDAKVVPLSVSNGGGIIYGYDKKSRICCIKNLKPDSAESIKSVKNSLVMPVLSADKTQILFASDSGVYYFDSSLKEDIKVTGSLIEMIYPNGGVRSYDSFKSFIAFSDGKVVRFTRKGDDFDKETLVQSAFSCTLSADGNRLVYMQDNELYTMNVSDPENKTKLGDEILDYDADNNLKNVYFLDSDNTLRYADGKSKSGRKIIDDAGDFAVNPDGVCVFTDEDDTLYYSENGSDKKKAGLEDVTGYVEQRSGIVYVESDGDIYVSTDGRKFSKP